MKHYIDQAMQTASPFYYGKEIAASHFQLEIDKAIEALQMLDAIKKKMFYNKHSNALPYVHNVEKSCANLPNEIDYGKNGTSILHAILGIATEAGELLEAIATGKQVDKVNLLEECGDVLWYMAMLMQAIGTDFETVAEGNIAKLRKRYPQKFTEYDANNRNIEEERITLQQSQL